MSDEEIRQKELKENIPKSLNFDSEEESEAPNNQGDSSLEFFSPSSDYRLFETPHHSKQLNEAKKIFSEENLSFQTPQSNFKGKFNKSHQSLRDFIDLNDPKKKQSQSALHHLQTLFQIQTLSTLGVFTLQVDTLHLN